MQYHCKKKTKLQKIFQLIKTLPEKSNHEAELCMTQ